MKPNLRRLTPASSPRLPRRSLRVRLTLVYGGLFVVAGAGLLAITYFLTRRATGPFLLVDDKRVSVSQAEKLVLRDTAGLTPAQSQQAQQMRDNALQQHASDLHQLLIQSSIALAITAAIAIALGWLVAGRVLRPIRIMTAAAQQISQQNLNERLGVQGPDDEVKELADTIDGLLTRLEAAFDSQRRFIANASHELRTPLTWERALLEVTLADPHPSTGSLRAACEELLTANQHQERLIEALLTLASSERGLDRHEPVDLAPVTKDIVSARRASAESQRLRLDVTLAAATTSGNPELISRLVANLVDNAILHNTSEGQIEVSTETHDGHATLVVSNTGPVVPPDEIDRLLRPFQRLDRTSHPDGHGLGLSIVYAIAAAHRADLTIRPRAQGGLDIRVAFPAPEPVGQRVGASPSADGGHRGYSS